MVEAWGRSWWGSLLVIMKDSQRYNGTKVL